MQSTGTNEPGSTGSSGGLATWKIWAIALGVFAAVGVVFYVLSHR